MKIRHTKNKMNDFGDLIKSIICGKIEIKIHPVCLSSELGMLVRKDVMRNIIILSKG